MLLMLELSLLLIVSAATCWPQLSDYDGECAVGGVSIAAVVNPEDF